MRTRPTRRGGPGAIRIVGGQWRRTLLPVPDEPGLRPTPGRVRETLFNWLAHAFSDLAGRSVLDLYAGSGALGFEAASRGAKPVVMVDDNPRVVDSLRAVQAKLSATAVEIVAGDAARVAERLRNGGRRFDVVFLDPPFGQGMLDALLPQAAMLCALSGFVYVEAERGLAEDFVRSSGLMVYRSDRAGDVFYHLLQRKKID